MQARRQIIELDKFRPQAVSAQRFCDLVGKVGKIGRLCEVDRDLRGDFGSVTVALKSCARPLFRLKGDDDGGEFA